MSIRTLMLVRHGHTVWNDSGGVAGRTDIELSEQGRQSVQSLAQSLPENFHVDQWFSSTMQRTRETSALLRQHCVERRCLLTSNNRRATDGDQNCQSAQHPYGQQLPELQLDDRLIELNFGKWEGMTWSDVHTRYEQELHLWGLDWVNRAPPGGESFAQQVQRCNHWLGSLSSQPVTAQAVLAVTHGGSIRALLCLCLGWPLIRAMRFKVDPASMTVLQYDEISGSWRLRMLNSLHAGMHP